MKNFYFLLLSLFVFNSLNAQIIYFSDSNFKTKLFLYGTAKDINNNEIYIDSNNNNQIEVSEALEVYSLNVGGSSISSLFGISFFTNLKSLNCQENLITSLNLSSLTNLQILNCHSNQLNSLDVSSLTNLQSLYCSNNQLTSLSVVGAINLQLLSCDLNQLSSINTTNLTNLQKLYCSNNQITSLDLSTLTNLKELYCYYNQITSINVSEFANLYALACSYNQLISMFIKNGSNEILNFSDNPNLTYICADEFQLSSIQTKLNDYGYTDVVLNSYCSFTPGGDFYTILGNAKLDSDNNGCNISDLGWSNFKFTITDGITSGSVIADTTGNYSIPVSEGTHTITPVLENPSYFTISPATVSVEFPTQTSPFIQDFCITPNGIHPDLEVTILPIDAARPGFDAHYKIIYKNKGNQTQSGAVNLSFNDAVLDLISANPTVSSVLVNSLVWDFTDLQPAESHEITFTLNVNSPVETPAVNGGDILDYSVVIASSTTDETPTDNIFDLNQTVVNSFDPNDKTCLEGTTITPEMVGNYVHYMIRFENTGTYPAENIVVKDMIDTTKFDVSTLVPTSGSHPFVTRITQDNKVEFIFENINLPFDDANNDGYVAFKIKTKPTLVVGNTFSNTASIYFDYNAPIVTDPATTTIAVLGTPDFEFSAYFNLYPNPATSLLNIDLKKEITVNTITIYNILGQQVLVIPNAQLTKSVDVSSLTTGNYFMKLNTDKGMSTAQFIKK